MPDLFDPIAFGAIAAPNRILMAPLTRGRATREAVPTAVMAEYYAQRAGAGLIISEATGISRQGLGWPFAPGLWNDAQIAGWKPVTDAVHETGGRIVAQLWHMGRQVHSSVTGEQPVSSSATTSPGKVHTYEGRQPFEQARPLALEEIPGILDDYARAAENALKAGFDGVQIHGANGYLIDQFLRDNANLRADGYGGGVENRIRLLSEVTERVASAVGADRTAVRLSPNGATQGVDDSNPQAVFVPARGGCRRSASRSLSCASRGLKERLAIPRCPSSAPRSARPLPAHWWSIPTISRARTRRRRSTAGWRMR